MLPVLVSTTIFAITLYLIFSEKLNRTIAALGGAAAPLGTLASNNGA
jgi:Na+/H+ antiporter NhaD/arsenite permease-like protein